MAAEAPTAEPTQAPAETPTETSPATEATPAESTAMTETAPVASAVVTDTAGMTEVVPAGELVMVREDAKLGRILVGDNGMTLYVFDNDGKDTSTCTGNCLANWPPLTVQDDTVAPVAADGIAGTLNVFKRDDGTYQVSINGMPLYYYAKDSQPGDTNGQGVNGAWWVVSTDATKVTAQ